LQGGNESNNYLRIHEWGRNLFYLKLINLSRIIRIFTIFEDKLNDQLNKKEFLSMKQKVSTFLRILVIMAKMTIVIHLITCAWLILSNFGLRQCQNIYNAGSNIPMAAR
jgi:hypothetical protein